MLCAVESLQTFICSCVCVLGSCKIPIHFMEKQMSSTFLSAPFSNVGVVSAAGDSRLGHRAEPAPHEENNRANHQVSRPGRRVSATEKPQGMEREFSATEKPQGMGRGGGKCLQQKNLKVWRGKECPVEKPQGIGKGSVCYRKT